MGIYHLMGLGRSPGAVTGPLSYLAHCYQRWNDDDRDFFGRSGEVAQRERDEKVGDVQALVLFSTREVLTAWDTTNEREFLSYDYVENPPGRVTEAPKWTGGPMKEVLGDLLQKLWPDISGGRPAGDIFWCEVNRRDIDTTYARVVRVVTALAGVGGQGKEMWVNLTGGNNVMNAALQLAATLSGQVARAYYVQAEDRAAEQCIRFTAEDSYWVDLPVMPLALSRLSHAILELVQEHPCDAETLYSKVKSRYWDLSRGLDSEEVLQEEYLRPLWKQGLIAEAEVGYDVGPQWKLIQPYEAELERVRNEHLSIEELARQKDWLTRDTLQLD